VGAAPAAPSSASTGYRPSSGIDDEKNGALTVATSARAARSAAVVSTTRTGPVVSTCHSTCRPRAATWRPPAGPAMPAGRMCQRTSNASDWAADPPS
jgi:hypothetical protein